jgi:hypothetical protein
MAPGGPLVRARTIAATVGCVGTPTEPTSTDAVTIVTGGSRGAGREIARELASRGYAVIVVYLRDQGEAEAAVDEIFAANGTALTVRADVTDELDVERLFDETKAAFGGVDVVVHAAMRGAPSSVGRRHASSAVVARSSPSPAPRPSHPISPTSCVRATSRSTGSRPGPSLPARTMMSPISSRCWAKWEAARKRDQGMPGAERSLTPATVPGDSNRRR